MSTVSVVWVNGRDYRAPRRPTLVLTVDGAAPAYFDDALARGLMPNLAAHGIPGNYCRVEGGTALVLNDPALVRGDIVELCG